MFLKKLYHKKGIKLLGGLLKFRQALHHANSHRQKQ